MPRFQLQLRVDSPSSDGDRLASALTEASERVRVDLYRKLELKVHSNAWVTIALGSDKGRRTVQAILEECRAGNVVAGSATVFERLDEAETAAADWFYVTTKTADRSFSLWDDYPSYTPGGMAGQHVMNHTFVSEEFVQACERSRLRGVSFLRCRSRGRRVPGSWRCPIRASATAWIIHGSTVGYGSEMWTTIRPDAHRRSIWARTVSTNDGSGWTSDRKPRSSCRCSSYSRRPDHASPRSPA